VLRIARDLPPAAREDDSVVQLVALALLHRRQPGDGDRAAVVLERFVERSPRAAAGWALLGRVHHERWATTQQHDALDRAIDAYRRAWEIDRDLYAVTNQSALLAWRGDCEELQSLLPAARAFAADDLATERPDVWRISNALELAVLAGDDDDAIRLASQARAVAPGRWVLESIARVEDRHRNELNPNVAMEWGWMRAMGKRVCFLRESGFKNFRADLGDLLNVGRSCARRTGRGGGLVSGAKLSVAAAFA
jgi:hypothetical protein